MHTEVFYHMSDLKDFMASEYFKDNFYNYKILEGSLQEIEVW